MKPCLQRVAALFLITDNGTENYMLLSLLVCLINVWRFLRLNTTLKTRSVIYRTRDINYTYINHHMAEQLKSTHNFANTG